jgi:hypothetical protein
MFDEEEASSESGDFEVGESTDYGSTAVVSSAESDAGERSPDSRPARAEVTLLATPVQRPENIPPIDSLRSFSDNTDSTDDEFRGDIAELKGLGTDSPDTNSKQTCNEKARAFFVTALELLIDQIPPQETLIEAVSASSGNEERSRLLVESGTVLLFLGFYNVFQTDLRDLRAKLQERKQTLDES